MSFWRWFGNSAIVVLVAVASVLGVTSSGVARAEPPPAAAGVAPKAWTFDSDEKDGAPAGWLTPTTIANAGWKARVVDAPGGKGGRCVELKCEPVQGKSAPFGNVMLTFDAAPYRGQKVVVSADVAVPTAGSGRAQLWLRVDRPDGQVGYFDNMNDRPITSREFSKATVGGRVDDDATAINIGLMVIDGNGPALLDNVSVTAEEPLKVRFSPPAPLSERGLTNLEALAHVVGYLRHYHPSDQAANVDWNLLTIDAVLACEPAQNAEELALALSSVLGPYAPTARFQAKAFGDQFKPESMLPPGIKPERVTWWHHMGYGGPTGTSGMVYKSERRSAPIGDKAPENAPAIGGVIERELPGGVFVRIPMVVYAHAGATIPAAESQPVPAAAKTEPRGEDRATRLAAVMLAWNVCQHFYPYFDVVKCDWPGALRQALKRGAEDQESDMFVETLRELGATLRDGHSTAFTNVPPDTFMLPINAAFLGEQLVVTAASMGAEQRCTPGDSILSMAGRPVPELLAEARRYEGASSDQHARHRVIARLFSRPSEDPVAVQFRTFEGQNRSSAIRPRAKKFWPQETRPDAIGELAQHPGVMYIDVQRVDAAMLKEAMPKLEAATGIVVDVRGYPSRFPMSFLGQLTDTAMTSPQWRIPVCNFPDGEKRTFVTSSWPIGVVKPRLKAKVAFITDGRAISAAETFMSFVANYNLGDIVGEATAGTNGNINTLDLPGGFKFIFTGMRVLRHDDSQFHGIGIVPTIRVERTPQGIHDGRDELLEQAIQAVAGPAEGAPAGNQPAQPQPTPDGDKRD